MNQKAGLARSQISSYLDLGQLFKIIKYAVFVCCGSPKDKALLLVRQVANVFSFHYMLVHQ